MFLPFYFTLAYSVYTFILPADHFLDVGASGNYFRLNRISGIPNQYHLLWRYGPSVSYSNSIKWNDIYFINSSISYTAYISESNCNSKDCISHKLTSWDVYVKSNFHFINTGIGFGTNMSVFNLELPMEVNLSYHYLSNGSFYLRKNYTSHIVEYNEDDDYWFEGNGYSFGVGIKILHNRFHDQKLIPYMKYNFIDTTYLYEYYESKKDYQEYYIDKRWELGLSYKFKGS